MTKIKSVINPMLSLEYITKEHENKYFDRKSARVKPSDIADLISAFANAEGGTIVIGISDKTKTLEGINDIGEGRIYSLINAPKSCNKPMPFFQEEFLDIVNEKGKKDRLLLLHIKASIDQIIRTSNNSTFLRIGDKTRELKGSDLRNLEYSKHSRHYEDECNTDAEIEDLDEQLITDYKYHIGAKNLSTYQILKARGFIRRIQGVEHLTNAAVLLFAKTVTQFFSNCRIRFIRYDGKYAQVGTKMNIIKDFNIEEPLPRMIEKAKQFLSSQFREFTALDSKTGRFTTQLEYPEFAWFEGIINAVIHREYAFSGNYIRVTMYDDRLEILSPGKLPNLVTVDNIQETRYSRNPQLARVLTEFGFVRELNEGVKRIYAEMKEQNQTVPIYCENEQAVILILRNNIEQRNINTQTLIQKTNQASEKTNQADQKTNQASEKTIQADQKTNQASQDVSIQGRILSVIKSDFNISQSMIAKEMDVSVNTIKYHIRKMCKEHIIKREGSTQKGKWVILK